MTQDFPVRRPGHNGKQGRSRSRSTPTPNESVKKKEGVGEFSPNMTFEYKADKPIRMTCTNCHRETNMYYSLYGEDFQHQLECGICGSPQGPMEEA